MENLNTVKHISVPSISKENKSIHNATNYSSLTHPSVSARSRDHLENIFKKINSGDNILSRIPRRLDPNIEFSDDEEEDCAETVIKKPSNDEYRCKNVIQDKENLKKVVENINTLGPPHREVLSIPNTDNALHCESRASSSRSIKSRENMFPSCFSAAKTNVKSTDCMERCNLLPVSKGSQVVLPKSSINIMLPPICTQKSNHLSNEGINKKMNSTNNIESMSSPPSDMIKVNKKIYNVLSLLGSGGSCKVYSVYDIQDRVRVAIKYVELKDTDPLIRKGYEQEIDYLQKLQNSNRVIKLFDFEYRENELLLVLEHGDIDFAKYLSNEAKLKRLTPLKIKFYWAQMLEAVADIHKYGIIHSDLKPANFLLVAGNLKLIDFGIATSVPEDKTSAFRDTQVGTLNYMSPEAITQMSVDSKQPCFKVGVKSDVWSLGCILYNLVYGVTPFHTIKSLMQKIYAITNQNYEIPFKPISDPLLLDVLKSCLKRNPKERASVEQLLKHPYLAEDNNTSTNIESINQNPDLQNVLKQMQVLTPNRVRYISKVVQELSEKSSAK